MKKIIVDRAIASKKRDAFIKLLENISGFNDEWTLRYQTNFYTLVMEHKKHMHNGEKLRVSVSFDSSKSNWFETLLVDSKGLPVKDESIGYHDVVNFKNINNMLDFLNNIINPTSDILNQSELYESECSDTSYILNQSDLHESDWFKISLVGFILLGCIFMIQ
jgi:hypothetical protein